MLRKKVWFLSFLPFISSALYAGFFDDLLSGSRKVVAPSDHYEGDIPKKVCNQDCTVSIAPPALQGMKSNKIDEKTIFDIVEKNKKQNPDASSIESNGINILLKNQNGMTTVTSVYRR